MWRIRSFVSVDWSQLLCATANFVALSVVIGVNYCVLQQTLYNLCRSPGSFTPISSGSLTRRVIEW